MAGKMNFDSDDSDREDDDLEVQSVPCLFCNGIYGSILLAIDHLSKDHHVDLSELQIRFNMDQYSYIKMINYVKSLNVKSEDLMALSNCPWNNENYLKPSDMAFLPWLTFDFEDKFNSEQASKSSVSNKMVSVSQISLNEMMSKIRSLESEIKLNNDVLAELQENIVRHGSKYREEIMEEENGKANSCFPKSVADLRKEFDEYYFKSYSHYDIHYEMLKDEVRTMTYKDAILKNAETFKDKVVMDLGCGTAILSMFCAQANAKKVLSVDQSDIIYKAMDIVKRNGFEQIEFIKGKLEETKINEKVDILVSEWMGYFLIYEGMLDSLIYARDNILKPGGILVPNRCTINLLAIGDVERHTDFVKFWDNVYGFNMHCMKEEAIKEASVELCNKDYILTDSVVMVDFDLTTATINSCNFKFDFNLKVIKEGQVTGFVGYFDTFFEMAEKVSFSTGPNAVPTHWKQTVFFLETPEAVQVGEVISGCFDCERSQANVRSLTCTISVFNQKLNYVFE